MNILDELGYQGPLILNIVVAIGLYSQFCFFIMFVIGFWINKWLNEYLKAWIREPRPKTLDFSVVKSRDIVWRLFGVDTISPVHRWGMPSGHAQSAAFAIAFFYFVKEKKIRLLERFDTMTLMFSGMMVLGLVTICQRWITEAHSIRQLGAGAIVGVLMAWIMVVLAKWIMVEYTKKPIEII